MHKPLRFIVLLAVILVFSACKEDGPGTSLLNYDGSNLEAPQFLPGDYQMAARFTPSETARYRGQFLEEIQVYLDNRPGRAAIIIYGEGTATEPGPVRYSEVVTTDLRSEQWNTHILSTPIELLDEDIWLAIEVRHINTYGSVGCDRGPADNNGDFLFTTDDDWTTLRDFTSQAIDINWNIRGVVAE